MRLCLSSHAMRMQGLLMDDMLPDFDKPILQTHGTATWLGNCRPQGSPYVRRLDIKVFPRWCAPAGPAPHNKVPCAPASNLSTLSMWMSSAHSLVHSRTQLCRRLWLADVITCIWQIPLHLPLDTPHAMVLSWS